MSEGSGSHVNARTAGASGPPKGTHGRNARVQARYDALMREGKHGHYETMFRVVREEVETALEQAAKLVEGVRACPFAKGMPTPDLEPEDPCPVCGDLGTISAADKPSNCQSASFTIRELAARIRAEATQADEASKDRDHIAAPQTETPFPAEGYCGLAGKP